jgi:hypothetical protein
MWIHDDIARTACNGAVWPVSTTLASGEVHRFNVCEHNTEVRVNLAK